MPTYVWSGAAGLNDGTSWTNAYTSIASTTSVSADTEIWVQKTHSETLSADVVWTNRVRIICVDKDASDALATGAAFTYNSNGGWDGNIYVYGCNFTAVSSTVVANNDNQEYQMWDTCTWTNSGTQVALQATANSRSTGQYINCSATCSGTQTANAVLDTGGGVCYWYGGTITAIAAGTQDSYVGGSRSYATIVGAKFVNAVDSSTHSGVGNSNTAFLGCEFPSGHTIQASSSSGSAYVMFAGCAGGTVSAAVPGIQYLRMNQTAVSRDTAVYRDSGATDAVGAYSYKFVSANTSTVQEWLPPTPLYLSRWVASGSQTITIYFAHNAGANLQDDEISVVVMNFSEVASPNTTTQWNVESTRLASPRGTAADVTTDGTSTWTGGAPVTTKQKFAVTIAPQQAGYVLVAFQLHKQNTTVYLDPAIYTSGVASIAKTEVMLNPFLGGAFTNEPAAGGGGGARNPLRGPLS